MGSVISYVNCGDTTKSSPEKLLISVQYLCQNKSLEKFWQNWQNYPHISVSLKSPYPTSFRSPLTPLFKGGIRIKVPLEKGDLGGSDDLCVHGSAFEERERSVELTLIQYSGIA
jgi:hypothetical protein